MSQPIIPKILYSIEFKKGKSYTIANFPIGTTKIGLSLGRRIPQKVLDIKGNHLKSGNKLRYYYTDDVRGIMVRLINTDIILPTKSTNSEDSPITAPTVNESVPFLWREGVVLEFDSNMTLYPDDDGIVVEAKVVTA